MIDELITSGLELIQPPHLDRLLQATYFNWKKKYDGLLPARSASV